MMRRRTSVLLCLLLLLGLCACGAQDSAVTELTFRDQYAAPEELTRSGAFGEDLSEPEMESLLTGNGFRDMMGRISLYADGSLCSVELLRDIESRSGSYTVTETQILLYPGALPSGTFEQTCTIHDTPVDAYRWKANGATCYTAAFVRPDTKVAVWATVYCNAAEGDRRADCITRLYEITEACLNPANTLTLDAVYSGADFPRSAETALVPVSLETEAALRAGAQEAMERYQAACAQDPVIPAQCVCDAMIIRAVSPAGDAMLADGRMAYLPEGWQFGVDDGYQFADGVPAWYSGQTVLRRGSGERAECLVGVQGFRLERGADGRWQVTGTGGSVSPSWSDCEDYVWVRWSV